MPESTKTKLHKNGAVHLVLHKNGALF